MPLILRSRAPSKVEIIGMFILGNLDSILIARRLRPPFLRLHATQKSLRFVW